MGALTFQSVMGFYKKHNQSVFQQILDAQRKGTLSPFVGAGLSVPFGYKQWGGVLKELAENILDENARSLVLDQLSRGEYEQAADGVLENYPFMLDQLPQIVSPDILQGCSDEKKRSTAAWVLPYLFRRELVMTTNFDRCLEECYLAHMNAAIPTVTPLNRDRLNQLQLNQELCLLKLHGDIGREAVSIDDLVFTGEQYETHYADGSPLVRVLTQRFSSRRMLFLGCSLSSDRTMRVLEKVVSGNRGIRHFAILGCKQSEINARMKALDKLGILPIFYDESNHDAVRVILERLLEETDKAGYARLRQSYQSAAPAADARRPLMFDSEYFPFTGREPEQAQLRQFCEAEDQLLWWAVTGPGGMGKSRLVYEFCKSMAAEGWKVQRFEASHSRGGPARSLTELPGWMPEADRTIVVLDDVQAYMESVCAWMTKMDRTPRSEELRILLLEREGETISDSSWLGPDFRDTTLDQWCHSDSFLRLAPMTDEQLMAVMTDYAAAAGQTLNAPLLLKTLARVDPDFKRPLYALAIADARCQGKDPTNWDRKKILDTLLDRELKFHLDRLQGIFDRKVKISKTIESQLEHLLANSCLRILFPLEKVQWEAYRNLQKLMDEANMYPEEFCQRLGILATAKLHGQAMDQDGNPIEGAVLDAEMKVIALSCPDLLKEHLVLRLAFEKKSLDLLPEGWHLDPERLIFLRRLWVNYPNRLAEEKAFWDRFFSAPANSGPPAWLYGDLLWGCTTLFKSHAPRAVEVLSRLYDANDKNQQVAIYFAKGLYNLAVDQSLENQSHTADRLEMLYSSHPDCLEIAIQFSKGLVNLSAAQTLEGRPHTVERLEILCNTHSDCLEIAIYFANGLVNLSAAQAPEARSHAIEQLEMLYNRNPDCLEIVILYAQGLSNLSAAQAPEDCFHTVDRLEMLYNAHSDCLEITEAFASGLVNLTVDQSPEDCSHAVDRLEMLYSSHPDCLEIAEEFAKGLFNLTTGQAPEDLFHTVDLLESLYGIHPNAPMVALGYARSLVNLAFRQTTEAEVRETLARSESVRKKYPEDAHIQRSHAMTWFNLTLVQSEEAIPSTVSDIAAFLKAHPDAIPKFREALDEYLSKHPDHADRYRPLSELGGDGHA